MATPLVEILEPSGCSGKYLGSADPKGWWACRRNQHSDFDRLRIIHISGFGVRTKPYLACLGHEDTRTCRLTTAHGPMCFGRFAEGKALRNFAVEYSLFDGTE